MGLRFDGVTLVQGEFTLTADLEIAAPVTAVIGPSGGGKSSLLNAAGGFLAPRQGRILWNGTDLTGLAPGERPVSMVFQDNNLFPHLSAAQNVGLAVRPNLRLSQAETARVSDALIQVGLRGFEDRKPGALSGGQQSRVALARVLVAARPLVLLDEPFAALGPALKEEMLELVRDVLVTAGKLVVMVTHDPDDARAMAEAVVLIADGVTSGPFETSEVFKNPPEALRAYLG